ncbi:hypothetical protein HDU88_005437 [Geranomyces variabilis]|nr:hypothetical protein HDU88_005437 [Geranomyces variabilis]
MDPDTCTTARQVQKRKRRPRAGSRNPSWIWNHFKPDDTALSSVTCHIATAEGTGICGERYAYKVRGNQGSLKGPAWHLRTVHNLRPAWMSCRRQPSPTQPVLPLPRRGTAAAEPLAPPEPAAITLSAALIQPLAEALSCPLTEQLMNELTRTLAQRSSPRTADPEALATTIACTLSHKLVAPLAQALLESSWTRVMAQSHPQAVHIAQHAVAHPPSSMSAVKGDPDAVSGDDDRSLSPPLMRHVKTEP